jgi:hypothetical protein
MARTRPPARFPDPDEVVARLAGMKWRKRILSDPDKALVREHIRLVRLVIDHLVAERGLPVGEAHGEAFTAGHDSEDYAALTDRLFGYREVSFAGCGAREPIIGVIAACYGWPHDPELHRFENPWPPLVRLILEGFTTSFDDAVDFSSVDLLVGDKSKIHRFHVCP